VASKKEDSSFLLKGKKGVAPARKKRAGCAREELNFVLKRDRKKEDSRLVTGEEKRFSGSKPNYSSIREKEKTCFLERGTGYISSEEDRLRS